MPRAPRFWGPRAYSLLFFRIFLFHLSVRDPNSAPVRGHKGAIKSSNPPENARAIKFKKRGPIKLGPNVFVPCFSVSARGPKEPKVLRKSQAPKFKKPETGFLFPVSAQDPNSAGPQRVQGPQKRSPQIKKNTRPQSLKSEARKAGPQTIFFCSFSGQGAQRAWPKKSYGSENIKICSKL